MKSIIIPAFNEAQLITQTLSYLLHDKALQYAHIIVVCNGCVDKTFAVVERFIVEQSALLKQQHIRLNVLETVKASKISAINLGLTQVVEFPVVLLDADILVSGQNITQLVEQLKTENLHCAAPKLHFQYEKSSWWVKAYYRVAKRSQYNEKHRLSNVIALSQAAVQQLTPLPDVIADDEYIRRQFHHHEYKILSNISFEFICPKNLKNLLAVLTRVERGNFQLAKLGYFDKSAAELSGFNQVNAWLIPIFIACKLYAKIMARLQYQLGFVFQWERDESNR
ncbi:glycosyltransferase [Thalassotalea sp. G2M2-11]|uniref:glycosyltransferase n=1 Tax=Thalassotalea sp. G2M2-11 TaxID=2787627 RepID=UPI0019CF726C|nr:glycosyltransferase [Thalassotalea sp. G2M2-11]